MKKTYKIEVDCANCANKMENAIKKIEGIKDATINFLMMKLIVEFEENANQNEVMNQVLKKCKKIDRDCNIYI